MARQTSRSLKTKLKFVKTRINVMTAMKKTFMILTLIILKLKVLSAYAADSRMMGSYNPRTGDTTLDATIIFWEEGR